MASFSISLTSSIDSNLPRFLPLSQKSITTFSSTIYSSTWLLNYTSSRPSQTPLRVSSITDTPNITEKASTLGEICRGHVPEHILQRAEEVGFIVPTDVQQQALPTLLSGRDCIIQAQTGSGKTLAYLLLIYSVINVQRSAVQALIVVPTRELGIQVTKVARMLAAKPMELDLDGKTCNVMALLDGGTLKRHKSWLKAEPPAIVVATMGSLSQMLEKHLVKLEALKVLVIDEVDFMLNSSKDAHSVRKLLTSYSSTNNRQTVFASASIPHHRHFLYDCIQQKWTKTDAVHVHVNSIEPMPSCLHHRFVICGKNDRLQTLLSLLETDGPSFAIIFVGEQSEKSKKAGNAPSTTLVIDFLIASYNKRSEILLLEENMNFNLRATSLSEMRQGENCLLVATDIAARGVDLPETTHIYNFDLPRNVVDYLHRAGRAGRKPFANEKCVVTNIITKEEHQQQLDKMISQGEINSSRLHTLERLPHTLLNRVYALVYTCGILALLYHHSLTLFHSTSTTTAFLLHLSLLLSDVVLAFMWTTTQSFRVCQIKRQAYPDKLMDVVDRREYPALDVFICTADPYKEPPINVVNTALSVMAYDYPMDKISIYISDDGGSELTLFAFMEAAKFAKHWLPYCRENNIMERCPEAYFNLSNHTSWSQSTDKLKMLYEKMKSKVENAVERGSISQEHIVTDSEREAFRKWIPGKFTRQDHPPVIQVLLESGKDKDVQGQGMPNLVYVSREKSKSSHHHFKAGALNTLLRVSASMTNSPLVLTLDCDMYSNDPQTPVRVLCYVMDPTIKSNLGYVQFPQRFHGINKNDIYGGELKRLFQINPIGIDGLQGPNYVGTGCFFNRRAFFGAPSYLLPTEIPQLNPHFVVDDNSIRSDSVLTLAHHVASCNYELGTNWGSEMGFRYGSLVEDYYTGYRLQCQGWKTVFCNPDRPAFFGDVPINLNDVLCQNKRWSVGLLEVGFSKYSPLTFGAKCMGILMGLCYAHYAFWPIWAVPITIYAFVPPLALLNQVAVFPQVTSPWFMLYMFLFLGGYGQDLFDFIYHGGTIHRWWNDQRMWMIRGVSSYLFGFIEYLFQVFGISVFGFNVTSKVVDDEQSKRYEQGVFDFGVASPLFTMLALAATINLMAFLAGIAGVFRHGNFDHMFGQLFLAGFVMLNCWPIYQAMALRTDKGSLPTKTTMASVFLAWAIYSLACFLL